MRSVGIDLVETARFRVKLSDEKFLSKVFTKSEIEYIKSKNSDGQVQSAAARFAAKEALGKALKIGIFKFSLTDIEVEKEPSGAVGFKLHGKIAEYAKGYSFSLSLTHTKNYASAVVLAEKEGE